MLKKRRYPIFLIMLFMCSIFFLSEFFNRPYYYFNTDGEADYLISAMFYSIDQVAWSYNHPGTLVQAMGGFIANLFSINILQEPEKFLFITKFICMLLSLVGFIFLVIKKWSFEVNFSILFSQTERILNIQSSSFFNDRVHGEAKGGAGSWRNRMRLVSRTLKYIFALRNSVVKQK